jgi:hypothetical protein
VFLPVVIFSVAIIVPWVLLQEWVADSWSIGRIALLLILPILLLVAMEIQMRLQSRLLRKSKRTLRLEEDYFRITPPNMLRMPWRQMISWHFQDVADDNHYQIVTVEFIRNKKSRRPRRRSIVLEKISQGNPLISELKFRRQKDGLDFDIQESSASAVQTSDAPPGISQSKRARPTALYLHLTGAFLVIEGLPMLLGGLGLEDDSHSQNIKPNPNGSFARFIRAHFSNGAEFKHFLLLTGSILCGSGVALIIWSRLLDRKQKQFANRNALASQ